MININPNVCLCNSTRLLPESVLKKKKLSFPRTSLLYSWHCPCVSCFFSVCRTFSPSWCIFLPELRRIVHPNVASASAASLNFVQWRRLADAGGDDVYGEWRASRRREKKSLLALVFTYEVEVCCRTLTPGYHRAFVLRLWRQVARERMGKYCQRLIKNVVNKEKTGDRYKQMFVCARRNVRRDLPLQIEKKIW